MFSNSLILFISREKILDTKKFYKKSVKNKMIPEYNDIKNKDGHGRNSIQNRKK